MESAPRNKSKRPMSSVAHSSGKYKPFNHKQSLRLNNSIGWNNYKSQSRTNLSMTGKSPRNPHKHQQQMESLDRNRSNISITIGSASQMIPTKARPKTGVNNLSMRSRRTLLKPSAKNMGSFINHNESSPNLRQPRNAHQGSGSPASLLKLKMRQTSSKRVANNASSV